MINYICTIFEYDEQFHEQRFYDVILFITLRSTNGSEYMTSSMDMFFYSTQPQQTALPTVHWNIQKTFIL